MKKTQVNFWLELSMFLCGSLLAVTGLIQRYVLPAGQGRRGAGAETLLGWTRHDFGDLHFYVATVLVVLLAVHIVLHWSWIKCRFRELRPGPEQDGECGRT